MGDLINSRRGSSPFTFAYCGVEQWPACLAHNQEVEGSNPSPATTLNFYVMPSTILPCSCKHEQQDEMYGKGNRVHNNASGKDSKTSDRWRCTVCENVVSRNIKR